jgi:signal transduction histidine kinase
MIRASVDGVAGTRFARLFLSHSEAAIATVAIVGAIAAVWLTLRADFLAYPGWLAIQKADFILGPVLTGLYWRRRRPRSRFGPLLIGMGLLMIPYVLQSVDSPLPFSVGVAWEGVVYVATLALILAFPTGRLDGVVVRLLLAVGIVGTGLLVLTAMVAPVVGPDGSISGCLSVCPPNGLFVSENVPLALRLIDATRVMVIFNAVVAIALIAHRFAGGTPPRRRALAIGAPIAVFCLVTQAAYQTSRLIDLDAGTLHTAAQWAIVITRASIWYGFLLALVAAELFAGRVLRRLVAASLRRPTLPELEAMLSEPLGDPELRLAFWSGSGWVDGTDQPVGPAGGRVLTTVERKGRPAVAIVHDPELGEDPELVHAAGVVALLARENAELEAGWNDSMSELRESRARIAAAGDVERRALQRDLHDGAQQQLTAILVKLSLIREVLPADSVVQGRIVELEDDLERTLEELRRLAHGIYPAQLAEVGVVGALEAVARRSRGAIAIAGAGIGRFRPEVESAVYYCCLEAMQNATKHAGPGARVSIRLQATAELLLFHMSDDGAGFDATTAHDGVGLRNMRDRLDAFGGRLEITSIPGRGTAISGAVPILNGDGRIAATSGA